MADVKTDQEPSIEEILESIRQIISEDGTTPAAPAPVAAAPVEPPPPPPAPKPAAAPKPVSNVLDLTDKVVPQQVDIQIDLQDAPAPVDMAGGILSDATSDAAAAAMARLLSGNVAVERQVSGRVGNVTLEDMALELMRPLIKSWLDQNLPQIVEKMVAKEMERISRLAMRQ